MDYHKDKFDDASLVVLKDSEIIALLPANRDKNVLYSHQGLTYGGLILNNKTRLNVVSAAFKHILQYLNNDGIITLKIKLLPQIYNEAPSDELEYLLFKLNADLHRCDVLSVIEPNQINLSRDRSNGVKRGIKHGLRVEEVSDFIEFWNQILIPNLALKHETSPVHTLEEIQLLKSKFPDQIRQFNVYYKDNIVAGTTIFETNKVAHSQYISGNADKNALGSLDFLHHHLLTEVFVSKTYFDFGISNENEGQNINEGLLYWKEGFGARSVAHRFYKVETKNHHLLDDILV